MLSAHPVFNFRVGDTIDVGYTIQEGDRKRVQHFVGVVISMKGKEQGRTFTVRKIAANQIGVERIFQVNSPKLAKIEVLKQGDVRRAKLYYLRNLSGKAARIKTKN